MALGADHDPAATPGFVEDGYEYYSVAGAERLREVLASFSGGSVLIAILGGPLTRSSGLGLTGRLDGAG